MAGFWHNQGFFGSSKTFQIIQKISRLSGNFPDHPDTFQIIRKPSRLSGNFLDHLDLIMPKVCNLCISLVWLCHHEIKMVLQKQHIPFWLEDQIAILCTFLSQKWFMHFICREKPFTHFFCRENNLHTSSGKFLRVEFCHPESSDFLGLCVQ